jgi:hypothetical protein
MWLAAPIVSGFLLVLLALYLEERRICAREAAERGAEAVSDAGPG